MTILPGVGAELSKYIVYIFFGYVIYWMDIFIDFIGENWKNYLWLQSGKFMSQMSLLDVKFMFIIYKFIPDILIKVI